MFTFHILCVNINYIKDIRSIICMKGIRLKQLREERHISQRQLVEGISQRTTLSSFETNKATNFMSFF